MVEEIRLVRTIDEGSEEPVVKTPSTAESPVEKRHISYHVRVGSKVGERRIGAGHEFDLEPKLIRTQRGSYPTIEAVYVRSSNLNADFLTRILPDGTYITIFSLDGDDNSPRVLNEGFWFDHFASGKVRLPEGSSAKPTDEIVVVLKSVHTTLLNISGSFEVSTIQDEFEQSLERISI